MKRLLFLLLLPMSALAQNASPSPSPSPAAETNPVGQFWRAVLPGGTFRVKLDRIQSVSTHEYNIEPLTHVTEFTLDAGGSVVARFYFLETVSPQAPLGVGQSGIDLIKSKAEEVATTVAGTADLWKKVSKLYPATTHAHTVEYRVQSKEDIDKLLKSAEKAWSTGRGAEVKLD